MKLALITQDFPPDTGGIQTYSWELARRFHTSVERFTVLTCTPATLDHERFDRQQEFTIRRCAGGSDVLPLSLAAVLPGLVTRGEVDTVLHAQWQTLPISHWLAQRDHLRGVFTAAHGRELLLQPLKFPVAKSAYDAFRRTLLTTTRGVFPVSRYTQGLLTKLGVPEERCTVVSNGTDPEHFRPHDATQLRRDLGLEGEFVLLFAGRLKRNKGVDTAILGLKQLHERCPHAVLLVAGEGDDLGRLQAIVQQQGLEKNVRFLGKVPYAELPIYYSMADVFVTLSREEPPAVEGFGLVFLEAGACETAVIGTNSGGIPDAIVDNQTGLLIPPNDPAAFAGAALRLAQDANLRTTLGVNARRRVLELGTWQVSHDSLLAEMTKRSTL